MKAGEYMDGLEQLESDLQRVVHSTTVRVKEHLLENIQKYIYHYGDGKRKEYYNGGQEPTRQFYESIVEELTERITDFVEYTIFSDPGLMDTDPETYLHGDIIDGQPVDNRGYLMEYLNRNISTLPTAGWWTQRQPFFDITLQELDGGLIWKFFEDEMKATGMDWF